MTDPQPPTSRKHLDKIRDEIEFYPHQIQGIRELAKRNSFLLADDMGLGKSLQALTVAAIDFEKEWAKRVLICCPATLKGNWADEIEKFTFFSYAILDGTPKQRSAQIAGFLQFGTEILIVNYEQVKSHLAELNAAKFDIAIFDEAHYIKSYKSQRTKAVIALQTGRSFLLTGSPMLNQVDELWPLLHKIDPGAYPIYWKFVNRYAVFGGFKDKQIVGVKNRQELISKLDDVMVRRLKKDVLNLPDKQIIQIPVDLHPVQRTLYDQAHEEMRIDHPSMATPVEIENHLVKILRLKQICGSSAAIKGFPDDSYKLDAVIEKIKEITEAKGDTPGEPVVVFTQFRKVQALIALRCQSLHPNPIKTYILNGDVPTSERQGVVKAWQSDEPSALVCMLQVAGVGLNLTAASRCIFVDKLFVPKLNEQAQDRLHRIGASTTQPIQIIEMIARKTIEQRIEQILRKKTKLFNDLVETSDWKRAVFEALTEEEEEEDE